MSGSESTGSAGGAGGGGVVGGTTDVGAGDGVVDALLVGVDVDDAADVVDATVSVDDAAVVDAGAVVGDPLQPASSATAEASTRARSRVMRCPFVRRLPSAGGHAWQLGELDYDGRRSLGEAFAIDGR